MANQYTYKFKNTREGCIYIGNVLAYEGGMVREGRIVRRHGFGTEYRENGTKVFSGTYNKDIQVKGTYYYETGKKQYIGKVAIYQGVYCFDGHGTYYYPDGETINYEGIFYKNNWTCGALYDHMGWKYYEGELKTVNGKSIYHGKGIEYVKESKSKLFEGIYKDDKLIRGAWYGENNSKAYEGEFGVSADGRPTRHGQGVIYSPEGNVNYRGTFVNDSLIKGTSFRNDGSREYEGEFLEIEEECNGTKESSIYWHGQGVAYYSDGTVHFKGEFAMDSLVCGTYWDKTGRKVYDGEWLDAPEEDWVYFNGNGTLFHDNGNVAFHGKIVKDHVVHGTVYTLDGNIAYKGEVKGRVVAKDVECNIASIKYHGHGELYGAHGGVVCLGVFENGHLVQSAVMLPELVAWGRLLALLTCANARC